MPHTPGPWHISSIRSKLGGEPVLSIHGPDDKIYAYVLYGDGGNEQHAAAYDDARLIAAAPALLEAATLAVAALDNSLQSAGTSTAGFIATRRLMAEAHTAIRAAIAQATKEE